MHPIALVCAVFVGAEPRVLIDADLHDRNHMALLFPSGRVKRGLPSVQRHPEHRLFAVLRPFPSPIVLAADERTGESGTSRRARSGHKIGHNTENAKSEETRETSAIQ